MVKSFQYFFNYYAVLLLEHIYKYQENLAEISASITIAHFLSLTYAFVSRQGLMLAALIIIVDTL